MRIRTKDILTFFAGAALMAGSVGSAQLAVKKSLTLDVVKQIAAAAEKEATSQKLHFYIVIVDDGGNMIYLERMDDTQLGSRDVSIAKARSALMFQRPTKFFEDAVHAGYTPAVNLPNGIAIEGGIPLVVDGKVIGAIGVSGGTPQQDGKIAQAGVDALPGILQAK
ncbi:MAG: heme-binding protein [Edaphobacter sp.]